MVCWDLQELDRQVPLMDEIDSKVNNEIKGFPVMLQDF